MIIGDENLDPRIISAVRAIPISVFSIAENSPGISDEQIAEDAATSGSIILTRDKDFADIVFAYGKKEISVILLRDREENLQHVIVQLTNFLKKNVTDLRGKFITLSEDGIRIHSII